MKTCTALLLIALTLPVMGAGWVDKGPMPTARYGAMCGQVNGKLYVCGGYNTPTQYGPTLSVVEFYDPSADTWATRASMPYGLGVGGAAVVNDRVYVAGGVRQWSGFWQSTLFEYNPVTDQWTEKTSMPTPRYGVACAAVGGKLFAIGGYSNYQYVNTCEMYDPATNSWTTRASMPTGRFFLGCAVVNGLVYAIGGGNSSGRLGVTEVYDPVADTWGTKATMPTARYGLACCASDNRIIAVGGFNTVELTTVEVYDPTSNTWTSDNNMSTARFGLVASAVNGVVYAIGGLRGSYDYLATNEAGAVTAPPPAMVWAQATPEAEWSVRWTHSSVAFNNRIWVMGGGVFNNILSDVWSSTDGAHWTLATGGAAWGPRSCFPTVVFNDEMWVLGGYRSGPPYRNDVWHSPDGVNWVQATGAAAWSGRYRSAAVVFGNRLWVLGGYTWGVGYLNDVWYSADGANWTQATPHAPWAGRCGLASVVYDNKIWVIGGADGSGSLSDVWYSSDGANWVRATANAGWVGKGTSVVFDNKMWVMGGGLVNRALNDVWYSTDGATWTLAAAEAQWSGRSDHTSAVLGDRIWVMGGNHYAPGVPETPLNDVWYYPSGPSDVHDVGAVAIVAPTEVIQPGAVVPKAVLHNYGTERESFRVRFTIQGDPVYEQFVDLPGGVPVGADTLVEFPSWSATEGYYAAECRTLLANDQVPANDAVSSEFVVAAGGWTSRTALPECPSGRAEGAGGWLAYNVSDNLIYAAKGENTADFYAFSPSTPGWTCLAPIQKGRENKLPEDGCRGVADGADRVYMTKGANTLGFWSYTISTDTWTQLADVPAGAHKVKGGTDLAHVVTGGLGYVYLLKGQGCEFYRYNTTGGAWERLHDAPRGTSGNWLAGSWLVYDGDNSLYAHKALSQEMYRFDISAGVWDPTALPGIPRDSRYGCGKVQLGVGGCAAWLNGWIYALKGNNTTQFWKYEPVGTAWSELDTIPQVGTGGHKKNVHMGGDITATPDMLFAFKGSKTNEFWRYVPWSLLPSDGGVMGGAGLSQTPVLGLTVAPSVFRGTANVRYAVPMPARISLKLYDVAGKLVSTLAQGDVSAGVHTKVIDAAPLPHGIYVVKFTTDAATLTRKLVIE